MSENIEETTETENNNLKNNRSKKNIVAFLLFIAIVIAVLSVVAQKNDSVSTFLNVAETESESIVYNIELPTIATEEETETETISQLEIIFDKSYIPSSYKIDIDAVLQLPELPTGCEVTSLTMVLNYWGYEVDKCELVDNYLPMETNGGVCGFDTAFIGSPYESSSFGCFAPVIVETAIDYMSDQEKQFEVADISGSSLDELFKAISQDYPIVIWATIGLHEPLWTYYWSLEDGTEVYFPNYEHCLVLTGYDKNEGIVYVNDPLKGEYEYDLELFEQRYEEMNSQAVIIY
jgi:uncharacterized protein YvpB